MKSHRPIAYFLELLTIFSLTSCNWQLFRISPSLPDLSRVKSITITDNWVGLSPVAPIYCIYTLDQEENQFEGTATFSVGGWSNNTIIDSAHISIPNRDINDFLQTLSEARPISGKYEPSIKWTDDYPNISIQLINRNSTTVVFHTESNGIGNIPWEVTYRGKSYIVDSGVPAQALNLLRPYLSQDKLENLIKLVEEESQ